MKTFLALTTGFLSGFIFCCIGITKAEQKEKEAKEFEHMKEECDELLQNT